MTPTPLRNIRVDDELWSLATMKAGIEGRALSDVIRKLLTAWTKEDS